MHYKTIILELLQQRPQMHDRLRKERMLLRAMERLAQELKNRHEAWKEYLNRANSGSNQNQIASEALEMALAELEARLPPVSQDDQESLSLDEAMAFILSHTSNA